MSEGIPAHHRIFFLMKKVVGFNLLIHLVFLVSFAEGKPAPLTLPAQTPLLARHFLDLNNVIMASLPDGTLVYNVFEVALQAMEGSESAGFRTIKREKGLIPRIATPQPVLDDPYQFAAFKWLEDKAESIGDDGLIWYYRFDNVYNDILTQAPWASAFGQAYVVKAFLYALLQTGEEKYADLATRAAVPFFMDVEDGGFQTKLIDGALFFEEIPTIPATHILNGHMISTITLLEAGKQLGSTEIYDLGKQGVETLIHHLAKYDLGYWSRYDLNPKKGELIFRFVPDPHLQESPVLIDSVSLSTVVGGKRIDLDVGALDDTRGAWRISGTEWTHIESVNKKTVRGIQSGPAKHCGPIKGGSIQNSYVIMQLPVLEFEALSDISDFLFHINYFDQSPGFLNIEIQDVSHGGFMGFRTLSQGTIYTSGSKSWKSAYIPVKSSDLAWYVGSEYQVYHIKLLKKLYLLTGRAVFEHYAERWQRYLDMHSEVNVEDSLSVRTDCGESKVKKSQIQKY
ncbi:MAG: hypothetical protein JKY62_07185 [Desulfocapsa sp.]|nr:hypothetical protein [Desulfocapsa sp.]